MKTQLLESVINSFLYSFTNGFGGGSYRNGNRLNSLHAPVQLPSNNPSNHAPRITHYQSHISYNSVVQNGGNQYENNGGPYNSLSNDNNSNSGNGGSGEHVSLSNNMNSGEVSMNMGGTCNLVCVYSWKIFHS